jgi:hypothetical protein
MSKGAPVNRTYVYIATEDVYLVPAVRLALAGATRRFLLDRHVCILPSVLSKFDIAEEHRRGLLTCVRIRDRTVGSNVLTLVHRDRRSLGAAVRLFGEELCAELHSTVDDKGRPRAK